MEVVKNVKCDVCGCYRVERGRDDEEVRGGRKERGKRREGEG